MTLGALIHAGLEKERLLSELKKLNLDGYRIEITSEKRGSISGIHVEVIVEKGQPERNLEQIVFLINQSSLSQEVKEKSKQIFQLLGDAEAQVHGQDLSSVHFHEVGAVDSIVDIVGSVIGIEALEIEVLFASAVNVGKGTVKTQHGTLPVPAPATASLLKEKPTYSMGQSIELTTPTGAALLAGLIEDFGDQPLMQVEKIGYGLGSADLPDWPNCLRILIGEMTGETKDYCWMIESNIDDMNPEFYDFVMDRLFSKGALDVFFTPVLMKKGRPATSISVLSPAGKEGLLSKILFQETTSLGLRRYRVEREKLHRKMIQVKTVYGEVPVKVAFLGKEEMNLAPEYEACRKLAEEKNIPLKKIYQEALRSAQEKMR